MPTRSLIVDGYNVLRSTPRYCALFDRDVDAARERLVTDVAAFAAIGGWEACVVFDGAMNPSSTGETHEIAGIGVIFSPHGVEADALIEDMASRDTAARREVTVVTSDAETQWVVLGLGATRMSAARFAAELGDVDSEWRSSTPSGSKRVTLDQRLDETTRDALARWARGEGSDQPL